MNTKLLIITVAFFATAVSAQAQFQFGAKAGLDLVSTTKNWAELQKELKGNYQIGAFLRYGKTLYIQPEVYYSHYFINESASAKFIKVPVMLGWKILDLGIVAPHINIGGSYIQQLENQYDTKGKFALEAGIGTELFGFITADLRYSFGMVKDFEDVKGQVNNFVANGGMLNLTVGVIF